MRKYSHRPVDKLPDNALRLSLYAKEKGITQNWIYVQLKRVSEGKMPPEKITFEVVVFQGTNFIVPKKKPCVLPKKPLAKTARIEKTLR